jgi:hypothetical protein
MKHYHPGECFPGSRLCYLEDHDPEYRALWRTNHEHCKHLGEQCQETIPCQACNKTIQVALYHCALFGKCSLTILAPQIPCCRICTSREIEGQTNVE